MKKTVVGALLFVSACSPDAQGVFGKMHEAACQGDADKFFVYVADDMLVENQVKRQPTATAALGADTAKALARESLNDWRKDITAKKTDGICAWTYVSSEHIGEQDRVELRSQAGNKKYMYFAKVGDGLKVVDFQAVDAAPTPSASAAPSASVSTPGPPLTSTDVCAKLVSAGVAKDCLRPDGGEGVSYKIPGLKFQGGAAAGLVLQTQDDKSYGIAIGVAGHPDKGRTSLRNDKTRTVLLLLADSLPDDTKAKTQAVLDAL